MSSKDNRNPVVMSAKEVREDDVVILPDGTKIGISPVSAALVEAVMGKIKDPDVPTVIDEESGREISNPGHPAYLAELRDVTRRRTQATIDAFVMFGINLPEGLPEDEKWLANLKYLERLGHLDLSNFDLEDPIDKEFLYKRYVVANAEIIGKISTSSGVTGEEIEAAEASFRS